MVRGNPKCPYFCLSCRADCRCTTTNCGHCHTCRDISHFQSAYYRNFTGTVTGCRYYSHDCEQHVKPEVIQDSRPDEETFLGNMVAFPKLFSSDIIEITIGKTEKEIRHVPKHALMEHSLYFKSAVSFNEKSGTSLTKINMELDVDRPSAFDRFIQFIYWTDYFVSILSKDNDLDLHAHAEVYVLAERLQASALKTLALTKAKKVALEFNQRVGMKNSNPEVIPNLTCIPGVVEMIYMSTPSTQSDEIGIRQSKDLEGQNNKDGFRELIAEFSAACLDELKVIDGFVDCMRVFPDFAVDIVEKLPGNWRAMKTDV